jgi:hypothetical protein
MAQLWSLDDSGSLKKKDVLLPEQIEIPCTPAELAVEEVVVVRPSGFGTREKLPGFAYQE